MKKKLLLVLLTLIFSLSTFIIVGCGAKTYTVSFNSDGGSVVASQTVKEGEKATMPEPPTKTGYAFEGWYYQDEQWSFTENTVSQDIELTAKWAKAYIVSFNSDGGSVVASQTVKEGEKATIPEPPTKTGYAFEGWYYQNEQWSFTENTIIQDIELTAKWAVKTYTISFNSDGGSKIENKTATFNKAFSLPTTIPTKTNYVFNGWYYNNKKIENDKIWQIDENDLTIELTAKWTSADAMSNFTYTVSNTGCTITDVIDKTISTVTIPECVVGIGAFAFQNCSNLTSITISNSVTKMGMNAFSSCYNISKVDFIGTIDEWVQIQFDAVITNPLTYAEQLHINGELITSANITTAKEIAPYSLYRCGNLTSIVVGNSVESIGDRAFLDCMNLTEITIGSGVKSIGDNAFLDCNKLINLVVDINNTKYCSENNVLYNKSKTTLIKYASGKTETSFIVSESVTKIKENAFINSTNLTSVEIGNNVEIIENYAFKYCTNLENVTLPSGLKSINEDAFYGCNKLKSITLPSGLTNIGNEAFRECTSLTVIIIPESVTSIDSFAFYSCTGITIYCEAESQPSGWNIDWNYSKCPVYWYSETEPTEEGNYWHYVNGEITKWESNAS